jgi:hypothetical protein
LNYFKNLKQLNTMSTIDPMNNWPDFEVARQFVEQNPDKVQELLDGVKDLLLKTGLEAYFGVMMLHKHFSLASNEFVLEETNKELRISTTRVYNKEVHQDLFDESVATVWGYDATAENGNGGMIPMDGRCKPSTH